MTMFPWTQERTTLPLSEEQYWRRILSHNIGFSASPEWVRFAREKNFQLVNATRVTGCPDCGATEGSVVGQFVYYSTLVRLRRCECELYYVDARIDPEVISRHFETAYKDEEYFQTERTPIFNVVAREVSKEAPYGASVLDIGGARGHLLSQIKDLRPDLRLTLSDVSGVACHDATRIFGLESFVGKTADLVSLGRTWDLVLLIDVVYYEDDIRGFWQSLRSITHPGSKVIFRVPNRLPYINLAHRLRSMGLVRGLQTRIPRFNREHRLVLSKGYMKRRLESIGFREVVFRPSPLGVDNRSLVWHWFYQLARLANFVTRGSLSPTSSVFVMATRDS